MAIKAAIKATMKNHTYESNGKILKQSKKGIIGLDLMRALSKRPRSKCPFLARQNALH